MAEHQKTGALALPEEPVDRIIDPIRRFMHVEAASGVVLLLATVIAIVAANSEWSASYLAIWKLRAGFQVGDFIMVHSLKHWVNDFLMAIFFFVIGLEVKREMVKGELQSLKSAALPIFAALGGMIIPAMLYLLVQAGESGEQGWGIPMATDIAFVVGTLAILGKRIPPGLRVLLLSLAIVDDIGAILVIAIGYTSHLDYTALLLGIGCIGLFILLQKAGVRNVAVYTVVALFIWFGFHESGIHATIAGVIVGLLTPAESWVSEKRLTGLLQQTMHFLQGETPRASKERYEVLRTAERAARKSVSSMERFENDLHPWVSFLIMPVFALANAGVPVNISGISSAVAFAVVLGLLIGKPLGIYLFSWMAIKLRLAVLPDDLNQLDLLGGGFLAGIGFTMALFIAGLALQNPLLDQAKLGIIMGSLLSALIGVLILIMNRKGKNN